MRRSVMLMVGIVALVAAAGSAPATPAVRGCNGLLAFASNHAQDVNPQIYRVALDGGRTDIGGSFEGDSQPQPSPDGSRLAFWSARPGGGLLVSDADGSHPRRMKLANGLSYVDPTVAWSPDSTRLAVITADTTGHVEVFDAASGAGAIIAAGWSPRWSPDGSQIAFLGYDGVSVARPDGSQRRLLAQRTGNGTGAVWSPDGTRLLVGDSVVPAGGGSVVSLGRFQGFAWTPDSSRVLAYATSSAGEYTGLWSLAADGSDPRLIAPGAGGAVLSPDGQKLVFLRRADFHILITDADGQPLRDLGVWNAGAADLHMTFQADWSPDGTKLLYWSGGRAVVADVESGLLRTLAGGSGESADYPVWSPDGRSVLVTVTDTAGNTDIYVARPDGTHVRAVFVDSVPEGGPSWSPNGRLLAFVRYGKTPTLVVSDLAGHARVVLRRNTLVDRPFLGGGVEAPPFSIDGSSWPGSPAWSSDGRKIAVATTAGILIVDVRSHSVRRLAAGVYPAWSRDGAIAYAGGMEGDPITVLGKSRRQFSDPGFSDPDWGDGSGIATDLAWSPDGSKLAYTLSGVESGTGYVGLYLDSIQIIDRRTGRRRTVPAYSWDFAWSPDGRYLVQGGFNPVITRTDGRIVAKLTHLRALQPSWQPLCTRSP